MRRALAPLWIASAFAALGCRQLAGIEDVQPSLDAAGAPDVRVEGSVEAGMCGCPGCVMLATGQDQPLSLVLVAGYVYFLNYGPEDGQGALMRVPATGGKTETVLGHLTRPFSLAADATHLYWQAEDAKGGIVVKRAISGGAPVTLASALPTLQALVSQGFANIPTNHEIVLTPSDVYFVGFTPGTAGGPEPLDVRSVPIDGGAIKTVLSTWPSDGGAPEAGLANPLYPMAIATDGTSLYAISVNAQVGILELPLAGGSADVLIANLNNPYSMTLDGNSLLFSDDGSDFTHGTVQRIPTAGGSPSTLVRNVAPWEMVLSQGVVYFINVDSNTQMAWIDRFDLTTKTLAELTPSAPTAPVALAVDSESVYWSDGFCGTVMKVPR